jgi:ribose transport system ATP-binding protein
MIEIARAFALSSLLGVERPILLLDEPTEGLTDAEVASLFGHMNKAKARASLIFVSHRLSEVLAICDRIYVFKDGQVVCDRPAKGGTVSELHQLMVGRARDAQFYKEDLQREPGDDVVMSVSRLSKAGCFSDVLGSGKEELGAALVGAASYDEGEVVVEGKALRRGSVVAAARAGVGHIPKERHGEGVIEGLSVCWNASLPSIRHRLSSRLLGYLHIREEKKLAEEYVEKLRIRTPSINHKIGALSGGNQQKVVVAKWLAAEPHVLILNNPTRGVDVGAKHELYTIFREIAREGVPMILISDELLELIGLSNRILVMREHKVVWEEQAPPDRKPQEAELVRHMV